MKLGKRKRAPLVKCGGENLGSSISSLSYEKSFCLCISRIDDSLNPRKWYMLNLASKDDKEEEEKNAAWLLHIPSAEHQGSHLAFHHSKRHRGEKPLVLPLITELEFKDKSGIRSRVGTRCAVMGSKIFRIGGTYFFRLSETTPWSRKVTYFDVSHPEEGWKTGPHTNCGRADATVVALNGKLYVFGGCHPDIPGGFFAEFLDTTTSAEEKGEVNGGWHHLQPEPPQSLGFKELFAAALDDGGEYSGKILVGSKITGAVCL